MVSEAWSVKNDEGGIAPSRRRCQQCCPSRRRYRCACYEGDSSWIHAPLLTHPTAVCALESGGHDWWEAASVHRGLSGPCWACTARRAYHLLADSPSVTWWMVCACAEAAARTNTAKLRSIRSRLWQRLAVLSRRSGQNLRRHAVIFQQVWSSLIIITSTIDLTVTKRHNGDSNLSELVVEF